MTWDDAKQTAARHFDAIGQSKLADGYKWPECLRDAIIPLCEYESDEDLQLLKPEEPGMTCHDQTLINRAFARLVKKHGAFPRRHLVRAADYLQWLHDSGNKNSAQSRAQFSADHAPMIATFDPHDREKIEWAVRSKRTGEIALAIESALDGFTGRLVAQIEARMKAGETVKQWRILQAATAFDEIVMRLALQILAGRFHGIAIAWLPNPEGKGSPDVIFRKPETE